MISFIDYIIDISYIIYHIVSYIIYHKYIIHRYIILPKYSTTNFIEKKKKQP